ncbi:VOC family protein [Cyclobacterium sp. SYSU L10401]|uniref:VOC family protein n=1 Tax=Cyclobacterium sp. SYSU L10401 TaxID=2678657 RepID=UPI0013CF99FE|nr:VOC family protein [Cyclobacterium sp. SYSU L10401]
MKPMIFVNLPVKNLPAAMEFYAAIGFTNNAQFTDETAACMVYSETIMVMLLTHDKFSTFTSKSIADTRSQVQVLNALALESKEKVDQVTEKALKAGGKPEKPVSDYGFMYSTSINDLDGHIWEFFWMDPQHVHEEEKQTNSPQ